MKQKLATTFNECTPRKPPRRAVRAMTRRARHLLLSARRALIIFSVVKIKNRPPSSTYLKYEANAATRHFFFGDPAPGRDPPDGKRCSSLYDSIDTTFVKINILGIEILRPKLLDADPSSVGWGLLKTLIITEMISSRIDN
ncbi:hypothetical protein EVAR_48708_1 [Eumeta japonica]|uniref:Uncharacterized protein n=1 Tax=Eumeta variegata TaxID=151549 RepID=A0A4C1XEN7_EUMVA|nr:hypothetical protein EVAR_48708_1 [Eumeta japonica]